MLNRTINGFLFKYTVLALCLTWLILMAGTAEVPADVGDGIMHYFFSQASWEDPDLFLHHWGKPFFILISSPFSQLGFQGMILFEFLVFTATIIVGYRILDKLGTSHWIQAMFAPALLLANDIPLTLLGGLTEPLFNLTLVLALYFFINERYTAFAVLISLLPFMRSEGQLPVLLALIILLAMKRYRDVPYLFAGFAIYAVWGGFVYGDVFWYFTKSPYSMTNDIYGHGTWEHYLTSYRNYLGNPGVYLFLLGIVGFVLLIIKKRWKDLQVSWWFLSCGIFFGIVAAHSYFWATGQNGSMGLTRIATQGVPLFLLLNLYYIGTIDVLKNMPGQIIFPAGAAALAMAVWKNPAFPKKADPMDRTVLDAAQYLKTELKKGHKVYYHYPLLAFELGINPIVDEKHLVFHTFGEMDTELRNMKVGDLIVWDSHFGPREAGIPLQKLTECPELGKKVEFLSTEQLDDPAGDPEGVIIFRYSIEQGKIPR